MKSLGFLVDRGRIGGRRTRPQKQLCGQRVGLAGGLPKPGQSRYFALRGPFSFRLCRLCYYSPGGSGQCGVIEKVDPSCYIDPSAEEPVMRKILFVIAIAAAVVGAGVVVASLADPELAAAKCTSRC
jgi:hypothetical protein